MAAGIIRNDVAAELLLRDGVAEASIITSIDSVPFRVRPDFMVTPDKGEPLIVNLKTVADASRHGFRMTAARFRWQVTHAAYSEAYNQEFGVYPRHVFIAHEKAKPYSCAVYQLDDEAVMNGEYLLGRDVAAYAKCVASDSWPEYANDMALDMPIYDAEDINNTLHGESVAT